MSILYSIQARLSQMISFGKVTRKENETLQIQFQEKDTQEGIRRIQPFGFYSNPEVGGRALVLFPDGFRTQGIVLAVESLEEKRPTLQEGSSCLYSSDGTVVLVEKGGRVAIRNEQHELISVLIDLLDQIKAITIKIPPGSSPSGPVTFTLDGTLSNLASLDAIQKKLKTFQVPHA